MTMSAAEFESGLTVVKAEVDQLDRDIQAVHTDAEDLKDAVKKYNELKQKEHDLRKQRKAAFSNLQILTGFYQRITGQFPDGMFPLFSQPAAEQ